MPKMSAITEAAILEQVVTSAAAELTPEAARGFLALKFDRATTAAIRKLLQQNNKGTISLEGRLTLEKYLRVGKLLDVLHARARLSLKDNGSSS